MRVRALRQKPLIIPEMTARGHAAHTKRSSGERPAVQNIGGEMWEMHLLIYTPPPLPRNAVIWAHSSAGVSPDGLRAFVWIDWLILLHHKQRVFRLVCLGPNLPLQQLGAQQRGVY